MIDRDPLDDWIFATQSEPLSNRQSEQSLQQDLQKLEQWIAAPPAGKRREVPRVRGGRWEFGLRLAPGDIARAQDLYRRLVLESGNGKSYTEEALLSLLALALDPANIAFFVAMLDYAPPRDKQAARRRELALAALALLVYRRDDPAALAALVDATGHKHPAVRALAVHYVRCVFVGVDEIIFDLQGLLESPDLQLLPELGPDDLAADSDDQQPGPAADAEGLPELRRPIPPELLARLATIATGDPAFEPRFIARQLLEAAGQPVPLDYPDGAYAFKVKLRGLAGMHRTIAARSTDTLHDLHLAIQHAIAWDDDHLYSFFLNNKRYDQRFSFASPWDNDSPPWADQVLIGQLGLPLKHTFMYYFDYGDSHQFDVEVVGIEPHAAPGNYPRVVERKGASPKQYWYGEDEDDEDGEDTEELDDQEVL